MSKNRPTLSIKPRGRETPATPQKQPLTLEDKALAASKAVWDARLAELRALRRTAGYED
jgi:hypothetical protein